MLNRYNLFNSVTINAMPAPGYSESQAIAAMERISAETLPDGYGYDWSGMTYQSSLSVRSAIAASSPSSWAMSASSRSRAMTSKPTHSSSAGWARAPADTCYLLVDDEADEAAALRRAAWLGQ